jgi:CBS domain-containing protein
MKVLDMMTRSPVTTSPDARLLDAAEAVLLANVSALPVVSGDQLVGIMTEGDLMRRWEAGTDRKYPGFAIVRIGIDRMAADFVRSHGGYVRELMTTTLVSVEEGAPVEDAIRLLERHGFKQLPVTREGKLSGMITRRNVLESFVRNARRMTGGEHSDEDIKRALLAIYTREPWAPLDRIDLRVKDGVVEITGSVERESQRQAVVAAAEGMPGVKKVIDHMRGADEVEAGPAAVRSFVDGQCDSEAEDDERNT